MRMNRISYRGPVGGKTSGSNGLIQRWANRFSLKVSVVERMGQTALSVE